MTKNNDSQTSRNYLSIQIGLDGLAFSVYDIVRGAIINAQKYDFKAELKPSEMFNRLREFMSETRVKNQSFSDVTLLYKNRYSTFVPKELFSEKITEKYIKYNIDLREQTPVYEELQGHRLINVFLPDKQVDNYIEDIFGTVRYRHYSSIMLKNLLSIFDGKRRETLVVSFERYGFSLTIINEKGLVFYNTFLIKTPKEFVYYILVVCKQLRLKPKDLNAYFLNAGYNNPFLEDIEKYFGNIHLFKPKIKTPIAYKIDENFLEQYYILLNSF